jgi:phosphate/sulfate permease
MYGMLCALLSAGLWLALATFLELPVSTTHSIVGSIVGMSMIAAGADSVVWYSAPKGGDNPFPGGVVSIVLAWIITPMMAALVAALLFVFTKVVVLNARNPFKMSLFLFPLYVFITIWVITYFVIQKGVNGWMKNETYTGRWPTRPPARREVLRPRRTRRSPLTSLLARGTRATSRTWLISRCPSLAARFQTALPPGSRPSPRPCAPSSHRRTEACRQVGRQGHGRVRGMVAEVEQAKVDEDVSVGEMARRAS